MKKSKFVLGVFAALAVNALVACGDDSSSAPTSAPIEDVADSSSSVDVAQDSRSSSSGIQSDISSSSVLMNSSSSSMIFIPEPGSSSSVIIPSCGTAVYTEKCIDTEFEGEICTAIGCHPMDCFEEQKGMEAYSCNGGSVLICDGTRWQYTNCVLPIIGSSSSSVEKASSSSAYDPAGANGKPCSTEDEVRLDETFEYRCVGGKWSIQGYNPNLVDPNAERCRSSEIEGSACDVSGDLSHMSVNGCEFFCYGGKWEYTPPPM